MRIPITIPAERWQVKSLVWLFENDLPALDVLTMGLMRLTNGTILLPLDANQTLLVCSSGDPLSSNNWDNTRHYPSKIHGSAQGWCSLTHGQHTDRVLAAAYRSVEYKKSNYGDRLFRLSGLRILYTDNIDGPWFLTSKLNTSNLSTRVGDGCGRITQMPDGQLVLPVAAADSPQNELEAIFSVYFFRSLDDGQTWDGPFLIAAGEKDTGTAYFEPIIVPASDGNWLAFFRAQNSQLDGRAEGFQTYVFRSRSGDRGRSWSSPEQCLVGGAEMDFARLSQGAASDQAGLMLSGVSTGSSTFSVSYDDGETWSYRGRIFDFGVDLQYTSSGFTRGEMHFAHIVRLNETKVLCAFSRDRPAGGNEPKLGVTLAMIEAVSSGTPPIECVQMEDTSYRWGAGRAKRLSGIVSAKVRDPQACTLTNDSLLLSVVNRDASSTNRLQFYEVSLQSNSANLVHQADGEELYGLTRLKSGTIIAGAVQNNSLVVLTRFPNGIWQSASVVTSLLDMCLPAGRIVELTSGDLLMPIAGTKPATNLTACGLLRLPNGQTTWQPEGIVATAPPGERFQRFSLHVLQDNGVCKVIAAVSARYPIEGRDTTTPEIYKPNIFVGHAEVGSSNWFKIPLHQVFPGYDAQFCGQNDDVHPLLLGHAEWEGVLCAASYNNGITWESHDHLYYCAPSRAWGASSPNLFIMKETRFQDDQLLAIYLDSHDEIKISRQVVVERESADARRRLS